MERRNVLRLAGVAGAAALAGVSGCLGGDDNEGTDGGDEGNQTASDDGPSDFVEVTAGPEGAWAFEPEEVEVIVGGTVEWYFDSPGHNITSDTDADPKCENPEGAEPFKSYEGDNHGSVVEQGATYSHTFEKPGEYTYVCVPHSTQMVGTVRVVES